MRPLILALLLSSFPLTVHAARPLPAADPRIDDAACMRIDTAPGPHSLLLLPDRQRLLISSHDRRRFEQPGDLYAYDTASARVSKLPRSGEPAGLVLRPHHMALDTHGKEPLLYLINHDADSSNTAQHSILVYAVEKDRLAFRQRLMSPLLSSPNHIAVAPDGDLYVTNDRRDGNSLMELLLRQEKATLVHYREGQGWRIAAEGLNFPNGVRAEEERVLAVTTFGNTMLSWPRFEDGRLGPRQSVVSLPALDGLDPGPEPDTWLTVSHGPLLDFLRHKRNGKHASAGTVFLVNVADRSYRPFFADDGHRISAMSNVVLAADALYIGQSFENFILRCPLRKETAKAEGIR